jgi:ABC-type multidrug transport system ATPase subunit
MDFATNLYSNNFSELKGEPMITLSRLSKYFSGKIILDNLNYEFTPGITHIQGINGSGKSTLLQIISGAIEPNTGEVLFDGKPLSHQVTKQLGYAPDKSPVYPFITGKTFLDLVKMTKLHSNLDALINSFAVRKYLETTFHNMSYGTQKKFLLIAAFMGNPKYLILDEPFNGLDEKTSHVLQEQLKQINKNTVCLIAAHGKLKISIQNCYQI